MLFGDIDWNQVLMKGLIGAAVGGAIGLCLGIAKMAGKKKKPETDGEEPEQKPRKD